jgi:predicted nuclease of predicted toxin-antitoxin system
MSRATDLEILDFARKDHRIYITLDAAFHALLVVHSERSPSVVRIRIEGLQGEPLAKLLLRIWPRIESTLASGAMVTITPRNIRIRRLPI